MDSNLAMSDWVLNWINGRPSGDLNGLFIEKYNPHDGELLCKVIDSIPREVDLAVSAASSAFAKWAEITPVKRGQLLMDVASLMKKRFDDLAQCIALETGKPPQDARGEIGAAIQQAEFFAGEGMRLYGRSLTSAIPGKYSHTIRQAIGVAGLIVPANTPIANIAWKTFPALICGNTVVLKASEDAPKIANLFAEIMKEAGIPDGVFNVIHGRGQISGSALVEDSKVALISFTGSTRVGRWIAEVAGKRLARVSLELGGKNPFIVCDDAELDLAVHWACLSAFSNAGQRCAAGSRIIVFKQIYEQFRDLIVEKAKSLKLGVNPESDLGPVISKRQYQSILESISIAKQQGARILCGGGAPEDKNLEKGFYIEPTIIEGLSKDSDLCNKEIFGPVVTLHSVESMSEALQFANSTEYGLTAAIHTTSVDRGMWFAQRVRAGVVNINIGTYGSEPHMPFGGFGASGNGTREPGIEALDVYSELKNISILIRNNKI
jgi:aldehyde dehydrogenase (NAD+)